MDIYHHGPGPMSIICQLPGLFGFSLVTTFKAPPCTWYFVYWTYFKFRLNIKINYSLISTLFIHFQLWTNCLLIFREACSLMSSGGKLSFPSLSLSALSVAGNILLVLYPLTSMSGPLQRNSWSFMFTLSVHRSELYSATKIQDQY